MQFLLKALVVGLAAFLPRVSTATAEVLDEPALIADTQYSAVFTQGRGSWLLYPPGAGLVVAQEAGNCRNDQPIAPGLWLIARNSDGSIELVAPSVTPLPAGHPDRVALLACDSAESTGLHLPPALIELLAREHGVVRVDG